MATVSARRIIAVSLDAAFRQKLAAALEGVGDGVDVYPALDGIGAGAVHAALAVVHLVGELARGPGTLLLRLPGSCPVIAVYPQPDLAGAVELMRASPRVVGMVTADAGDPYALAAMAARVIDDDLFGVEKLMPGVQIHARFVGDHQEKLACMAAIAELLEQVGSPRRYLAPIETCIDEMLMNALYDAPVGAKGEHIFAGVPTSTRITQRTDQTVAVQYACDGRRFAVSVCDSFGALDRQTVLRHLHKGLHAEQQVDRKVGGAGLGLYLMTTSATAVHFHVLPGIATEATCAFDLEAPKLSLEQLGFVVQSDPRGRVPAGPARRRSAGPRKRSRGLTAALAAGIVGIGVLLGALVMPRRFGCGGANHADEPGSAAPVVATVEIDSQPTEAALEIDGKPAGSTPVTLTQLPPGATVSITFKRRGYRTATVRLVVPAAGARTRLVQPLEQSDELVRVRFVSRPPGAEVIRTGQAPTVDRTYTPAEVLVEASKEQRFTLIMPGRVPLVIPPFTPGRAARGLEKGGDLVEGATLRLEAPPGGTVTVSGAPHCRELAVPAECTLAPGRYAVEYRGPNQAKIARTVTMGTQDLTEKLGPK